MTSAARPRLVVLSGAHKGDVIVLDDPLPVVFGTRAGVSLPDPKLDPVHCQVFQAGGRWFVQDFASAAGTWLGDERVEGARPLDLGRSFRVGDTHVALLLPDQEEAAEPSVSPAVAAVVREAVSSTWPVASGTHSALAPPPPPRAPMPSAPPPPPREDESTATGTRKRKRKLDARTEILPILEPPSADLGEDEDLGGKTAPMRAVTAELPLQADPFARPSDAGEVDAAPQAIGDYDVLAELGEGSLGKVYKAYDRRRRRLVAVKVLAPELAKDPELVARFLRGAQAGARLTHPHIAAVLAAGHAGRRIYVTMEYVEGQDLEAHVPGQGGKLSPRQALAIIARVTDGLVYAHGRDVLHRNVCPRNVLVAPGGVTKLADLAMAKRASADKTLAITRSGRALGHSPYGAPELIFDVDKVDARADVYGVGATLFFALTGKAPFEGSTKVELVQRIQRGERGDLKKLAKGLSRPLLAVVDTCLAADPASRYQAARELRDALAELPETAS